MARIDAKTKRYPSDLTDAEGASIAPLLPRPSERGRSPTTARVAERDPVYGACGLRVADAPDPLSTLADWVLVVPPLRLARL